MFKETKAKVWFIALIGIAAITFVSMFWLSILALEHKGIGTLDFTNNNFFIWLFASLSVMATATTGILIFKQFKIDSKRLEQIEGEGIRINIQPINGTLSNPIFSQHGGIELWIYIENPSPLKKLICEIFIVFENQNDKHEINKSGDYRNFNFINIIPIPSFYTFRGHLNIPRSFQLTIEQIKQSPFYLIVNYAIKDRDNNILEETKEYKCCRFEPKFEEEEFVRFRYVAVLDPPDYIKGLLS